ncbi:MAG: hypothetical protein ACLGIR_07160 [Actinomycetes bacterium]
MATDTTFDDEIEELGFVASGQSRRGGRMWQLAFNRFLTFTLHDYHDAIVFTWSFQLGEHLLERGLLVGAGETSFQELYPQNDVKLPLDISAVEAEIRRTLLLLRLDLGDPAL